MSHPHSVSNIRGTSSLRSAIQTSYRMFGVDIRWPPRADSQKWPVGSRLKGKKAALIKRWSEEDGELPIAIAFRRNGKDIVVRCLEDLVELEQS